MQPTHPHSQKFIFPNIPRPNQMFTIVNILNTAAKRLRLILALQGLLSLYGFSWLIKSLMFRIMNPSPVRTSAAGQIYLCHPQSLSLPRYRQGWRKV